MKQLGNRIVLDESDFRDLVKGKVVTNEARWTAIILSDIGFERMVHALVEAMAERGLGGDALIRMVRPAWPKGDDDS